MQSATHTAHLSSSAHAQYKERIYGLLGRLDKHGAWLKKELAKVFGKYGPSELIIYRHVNRRDYADGRLGKPVLVVPLFSGGSRGGGGGMKGWHKRMGDDFFDDPEEGVITLQHWIEKEDIYPRILHVLYEKKIGRGMREESVRIAVM